MGADWYFDDYNLDPSIQSMLKALSKIEKIIEEKSTLDFSEFGDWLLNKVTFLYFDMENRKNGEETFVVINTTGESLSSTQNLKPLVLHEQNDQFDNTSFSKDDKTIDKCWEEIETWFWQKRQGENDTADAGFAEFLRWVSIIEQVDKDAPEEYKTDSVKKLIQLILQGKKCDFPYKEISFKTIYSYWKALIWIDNQKELSFVENYLSPAVNKDVNNRNAIGQNDCFVLLPVLKYVYNNILVIESDDDKQRNAKRIYEFFKNLIRIDNVSKAVNTLVGDTIKIIDLILAKNGDLVDLIDPSVDVSGISKQILTDEEKRKLEILKNSADRNDIEEAFWEAQKHKIWSGEILPMIEWATDDKGFSLIKFKAYKDKFAEVFAGECNANIDETRRALLTRGLNNYPRIFKGYTNISFGWEWSDWQVLINDNKDKFKEFFDDLLDGNSLEKMISNYNDTNNTFFRFVKQPELLNYCEQKNIQKWDNSYCLVKQHKATKYIELETFCLYLEIIHPGEKIALSKNDGIDCQDGKMRLSEQDQSALVFDKELKGLSVAIYVHYNRKKADDWDIQLRQGQGQTQQDLANIASSNELFWNGEIYESKDLSRQDVVDKINALLAMQL